MGKLAKTALLRDLSSHNPDSFYNEKKQELLSTVNALGIEPMGMGGETTALAVLIETAPAHIASLPAAVSIQCHCDRRKKIII